MADDWPTLLQLVDEAVRWQSRRYSLSPADADDLRQDVLRDIVVSRNEGKWEPRLAEAAERLGTPPKGHATLKYVVRSVAGNRARGYSRARAKQREREVQTPLEAHAVVLSERAALADALKEVEGSIDPESDAAFALACARSGLRVAAFAELRGISERQAYRRFANGVLSLAAMLRAKRHG